MFEVLSSLISPSVARKTHVTNEALSLRHQNFLTFKDGKYHYFKVKIVEDEKRPHFLKFAQTPPILVEGYVVFNKLVYRVSVQDILRARIQKSNLITRRDIINDNTTSNTGTTASVDGTSVTIDGSTIEESTTSIRDQGQSRISEADESEELKEANAYLDEQIRALRDFED